MANQHGWSLGKVKFSLARHKTAVPRSRVANGRHVNGQVRLFHDLVGPHHSEKLVFVSSRPRFLTSTRSISNALLQKVSEDADFAASESNRAFVLAQYFGYLRRSPADPPDADFSGFNFWLAKLNSFGGDFRKARAFLSSTEYRQRFGQP